MPIIQTPSIASVVEDQTPQLGGDLDCQDYRLQWSGSSQYIGSTILGAGLTVSSGSNNLTLISNGNLSVNTGSSERAIFQSSGGLSVGGAVAPLSIDSFYDLGTTSLRWNTVYADSLTIGDGVDAVLTADAADELALRNGTNAQKMSVYNTWTDGANFEALSIGWDANVAKIDSTAAGTGTARAFDISYNGSRRFRGDSVFSYMYQASGTYLTFGNNDFKPQSGSTIELGTAFARWLNTYTDTITIGNGVDAILTADADNELALRNGTNAQALHVYNTYTDASNYERLEIKWDADKGYIGTTSAGTGTDRTVFVGGDVDGSICGMVASPAADIVYLTTNNAGGNRFYFRSSSMYSDGGVDLGISANRWATTYTDGIATNVETFTAASDTLDEKNNVCLCDCTSNAITLALPVPVAGLQFHIKKIDGTANTVNIEPDDPGPELIDGAIVYTLSTQYNSVTVVSDGSNWFII